MKRDATGPALSAIFVDYDNIYLSLKRKNDDAAKRFSKDAALWIKELETGRLITTTNGYGEPGQRRIVMNRCYGNPMPRRNGHDNSTDMNSFPFVRHHFLRAGSEVIDCPPLTAQLKNSADIRMVMDIRDMLTHDTYFDEFIILSGDADFTPLLHRLRAHARRTIIFSNDHTASPYTAISDGEVRESNLLQLLMDGQITSQAAPAIEVGAPETASQPTRTPLDMSALRREIVAEVANLVRGAGQPIPLEALADRCVRQLGHEKTAGTGWGGLGGFRDLLTSYLPADLRVSDAPPFVVFEVARMVPLESARLEAPARLEPVRAPQAEAGPQPERQERPELHAPMEARAFQKNERTYPNELSPAQEAPLALTTALPSASAQAQPLVRGNHQLPLTPPAALRTTVQAHPPTQKSIQDEAVAPGTAAPSAPTRPAPVQRQPSQSAVAIQQAVARIYDACQAPPLSPPEYRALFEIMATEITTRGLTGSATLDNIAGSAKTLGIDMRRDDVRFILEVVSETDPWFEQGASANLFASRFRNFVIARCRTHGLTLSAEELDLIEHWFAGTAAGQRTSAAVPRQGDAAAQRTPAPQPAPAALVPSRAAQPSPDSWWSMPNAPATSEQLSAEANEEFPRIIRSRMRG